MATSAERRLRPKEVRQFGSLRQMHSIPDLTEIQTRSYEAFLQYDVAADEAHGPGHRRRAARDLPDRKLRQDAASWSTSATSWASPATNRTSAASCGSPTAGRSASGCGSPRSSRSRKKSTWATCRSCSAAASSSSTVPNASWSASCTAAPASTSSAKWRPSDRRTFSCRIIPERGSWIELNTSKKDTLSVRIDQSGKFSAMTLLRAMDPKYSLNADLIRVFYETSVEKIVDGRSVIEDRRQDRRRRHRLSRPTATRPAK